MNALLYDIRKLKHRYQSGKLTVEALRGLDLSIESGKLTCLSGPSGSGKSTLLHLMALIENKQEGELYFQGTDLSTLDEKEKNRLRRYDIGLVFQQFHLFPVLNAEENVTYFLYRQALEAPERKKRVQHALTLVGLWEHRHKKPSELSGGQQQRVAIARALAKHPQAIIADEPTASLDQSTGQEIMDVFAKLCQEGSTVILASHDTMVHERADSHWVISDGTASKLR